MASVEGRFYHFYGEDADAAWKQAIQRAMEVGGGDRARQREAGDLSEGMNASVRSAGALGKDRLPGDVPDGCGKGALHGWQMGLNLPSVEAGSVVAKDQLPESHGDALDGTMSDPG